MLKVLWQKYYKVKSGQTLREIAETFCVSERALVRANGLKGEPFCGQVLEIPKLQGNAYTVKQGDTKELLCGSEENFLQKNGTERLYLGMRVIL